MKIADPETAERSNDTVEVPVEAQYTPNKVLRALDYLSIRGPRDIILMTLSGVFCGALAWVLTLSWAVNKFIL